MAQSCAVDVSYGGDQLYQAVKFLQVGAISCF